MSVLKQIIVVFVCIIAHNGQSLVPDRENLDWDDIDSLLELHCPQPCVDVIVVSTTAAHLENYLMALDIFTIDTKNVHVLYQTQKEEQYASVRLEYPKINFVAYSPILHSFVTAINNSLIHTTEYVLITYDTQYLRKPLSLTYCIQNLKKTKASSWYLSMNLKAMPSQTCEHMHDDVYAFSCSCIAPASHSLLAGIHCRETLMNAASNSEIPSLEQLTAQLYTIQARMKAIGLFFEQSIINESWLLA